MMPSIRPSMVRRMQRVTQDTKCYFISEGVSAGTVAEASKIPDMHHPVVSWLVPNMQDPNHPLEFCFGVKEVQRYIATFDDAKSEIPMFGLAQMRTILSNTGIDIANNMPREFRFIMEEFDFLPMGETILKEDKITQVAINAVEVYVEKQEKERKSSANLSSYVANFWKWTKDYLTRTGESMLSYVLGNPWWITVIQFLAKIIRLVICAGTSLVTASMITKNKMLDLLKTTFEKQMRMYSFFPMLIIEFAQALLPMFMTQGASFASNYISQTVRDSSLFQTLEKLAKEYFNVMMVNCGMSFLMGLPKLVFRETTSIFENFLDVSDLPELNLEVFYGSDLDVFGVLGFLDAIMAHLEKEKQKEFITFTFGLFPSLDKQIQTQVNALVDGATFTWISMMKRVLTEPQVQAWLREIYFWIVDIVPCLFHFFVRNYRSFLMIRVNAPQTENAACCLRDVVMDMQKTAVVHGTERGKKEQADAQRKVGFTGAKTEKSWISYLLSRPFSLSETPSEQQTSFENDSEAQKKWADIAPYVPQEESKTKQQSAATHTMRTFPVKQNDLWVAQCTQDDNESFSSHVFPNPVCVFKSRVPFYFERHAMEPHQICVTPSSHAMRSLYPRAMWKWQGQQYVLVHQLPEDVVHHLAKMQTPVFALSALE